MKKILLLMLLSFVSGCGFVPMHSGQTTDIYVAPISGINGIELRNALWVAFGNRYSQDAKYTLNVRLSEPATTYKALEETGNAAWQEVSLHASYQLYANGQQISSGSDYAAESYPFVSYLVASNASYNNAVENVIRILSEKISTRVITETYKYEHK